MSFLFPILLKINFRHITGEEIKFNQHFFLGIIDTEDSMGGKKHYKNTFQNKLSRIHQ